MSHSVSPESSKHGSPAGASGERAVCYSIEEERAEEEQFGVRRVRGEGRDEDQHGKEES